MTDFLFTMPSFGTGFARAIDVFGALSAYNMSEGPFEADRRAAAADWCALRGDLERALESLLGEPEVMGHLRELMSRDPALRRQISGLLEQGGPIGHEEESKASIPAVE